MPSKRVDSSFPPGGDESSREVLYGAQRYPDYGLIPRRRAKGEGQWLPLSVTRHKLDAGVARRQLNGLCLIGDE